MHEVLAQGDTLEVWQHNLGLTVGLTTPAQVTDVYLEGKSRQKYAQACE